ncbi:MAG: ankyrin repeat domain-containing protein [Pseudomonadota bacterium]
MKLLDQIRDGNDWAVIAYLKVARGRLDQPLLMGNGPLYWACDYGRVALVKSLVKMGANVNQRDEREGLSPINAACGAGHPEVVRILLDAGSELDISTPIRNPLFSCISSMLFGYQPAFERSGRTRDENFECLFRCAKLLIEAGIDLSATYNTQAKVDMTADAFACMYGREDIAALIIDELYHEKPNLHASAWAEAREVAIGNAWSRQKFRRWRYPPRRGKNRNWRPPLGEYWQSPEEAKSSKQ